MQTTLRVFGIESDSIVDGPGLRLSVFTQGCPHHCPGCHNPQSHEPSNGCEIAIDDILEKITKNPLISGMTLSGGEPLEQAAACLALVKALPPGLNTWIYSGWTFEEIMQSGDPDRIALVKACDVLVDGRFIESQRSLELRFCGSRNQRLIDIKKTLAQGGVVLWEPPVW